MARYLTAGVVVLGDDHPHTQATIETARAYARHRFALGRGEERFADFDEVVDPGRSEATVRATFKEAARRQVPWVALRRDLDPPKELLAQLLEATARETSKELPGFIALLTGPKHRRIRRILAIVDRSDQQPSGLLVLAAVAAAEATGAAVDVLVIGAPHEELDPEGGHDKTLRVARDRDLYDQAKHRSESLGARGTWMYVDHPENRVQLVRDTLAAKKYDLVVDDLGDINLGGRMGRHKRIEKALRKGGPAGITLAVLRKTDLPVVLVLDAVRLGLVPARAKAVAGAGVLALGVAVSGAPAAAASSGQRSQAQTSVSQTVDSYDDALTAAASMAAPTTVAAATAEAQEAGDEAQAALTGAEAESTDGQDESGQAVTEVEEQTAEEQTAEEQTAEEHAADEETEDEQAAAEQTEDTSDEAAAEEPEPADVAPVELSPESVTPEKAEKVEAEDVEIPEDLSGSDVDEAQDAAASSESALDGAEEEYADAQDAATEAKSDAVDASAKTVEASSAMDQANEAFVSAAAEADEAIASATGLSAVVPGGSSTEDMEAAQAAEAEALADLEEATQHADDALAEYEEAATEATETYAELEEAATQVTQAQTEYNEDQATAQAYTDEYEEVMAESRVSPVAEGEYTSTGHYGQAGPMWSTGYHTGEDYAAPTGTDVVAAGSGTVVEVVHGDPAYGNRIVIEHENGYYTTYNHLSSTDVVVGDEVTAGDKIGEVGSTGNSSGSHLHFEVTQGGDGWSSGSFVDPHDWLSGEVG